MELRKNIVMLLWLVRKFFVNNYRTFTQPVLTFPTPEHRERLLAALRAARKAKNPYLVKSINAALEGRDYDPISDLPSIHPEMDEFWR